MVTSCFVGGPRSSVDTNFQRSIRILLSVPPASRFFDAPNERAHCLARLTSRPRLKPSPREARSFNSKKKERRRQGEVLRKQCKLSFRKSTAVARWKSLKWMSLFPCQTVFSTSGFRKLNGREIPMVTCKSPSSLSRPLIVLHCH